MLRRAAVKRAAILVVEDEEIVAKDIETQLRRIGYSVRHVTSSGEEAIRKAARFRPDAVLMDIVLKGKIDGIAAAGEIRKLGIPVIYLTSSADEHTLSRAKRTAPYGYVLKPFSEEDLRAAIEIAVFRHGEEKSLNSNGALLKSALSCSGSGVIIADADMSVTFMNRAARQLTGWRKDAAMKRRLGDVFMISGSRQRSLVEKMTAIARGEGGYLNLRDEITLLSRDGEKRKVHACISSVRDNDENALGLVIVFHASAGHEKEAVPMSGMLSAAYGRLMAGPLDCRSSAVLKAVGFIEQNLGSRLALERIARSVNMSKYHFARMFRDLTGESPMSFAAAMRIELAGELLKRSSVSVSEAASLVGFGSASHFVQQFRRRTGMTPTAFRASCAQLKRRK
jgi:PAS domain S-box-containing protein